MFISFNLNAQSFILPTIPESVLPTAADVAMQAKVYNTSSYSYEKVSFNVSTSGVPSYVDQDLYVYAWSSYNSFTTTGNGITFRRKNAVSGITEDEGFLPIPKNKEYLEVGLIQDINKKVYVIMLWNGIQNITLSKGTFYDLFEWKAGGLVPTADSNVAINSYFGTAPNASKGYRVAMDCRNLNEVIFCWEEEWKSTTNPGGVFLRYLKVSGMPPFLTSPNIKVSGVIDEDHYPDVAFAKSGNNVRIAYRDLATLPGYRSLKVQNTPLSTLSSLTLSPYPDVISPPIPITFINDFVMDNYIKSDPLAIREDQLSLDCPDNFLEGDPWSVVVKKDVFLLHAITEAPTGMITDKQINVGIEDWNNNYPIVSYQTVLTSGIKCITYAWYCDSNKRYLSTQLDYEGVNFINPVTTGKYFIVNQHNYGLPNNLMAMPTMSRNDQVKKGLLIAYPYSPAPGVAFDMRSKLVPTAPILTFRSQSPFPQLYNMANVYPNPCTNKISLEVPNWENKLMDLCLINAQGKTLLNLVDINLNEANEDLNNLLSKLTSGTYTITLVFNNQYQILKFVKL